MRPVESIRSRSVDVAPTATVNTMPDSSVALSIPMTVWNWAAQQTTPTHGLWTYGNWAGSGGMGVPTNNADAGAMMHDYCYHQGGFTAGSNFQSDNAQLQACNQSLCNTEEQVRQGLITQGAAKAQWTSRGASPMGGLTAAQNSELQATSAMIDYFTWGVPSGNACKIR